MASRLSLSEVLHSITNNVYYQPPESVKLKFPCIVYKRTSIDETHADDTLYLSRYEYQVTYISKEPDTTKPEEIARLPYCSAGRFFVTDSMYHYPFTIFW